MVASFTEGTPNRDCLVREFKAGVGMLAAGSEVPVIPCYLSGCFGALPPGCRVPQRRKIALHVGEAVRFGDTSNDKIGWLNVAHTLEAAVRRLKPQSDELTRYAVTEACRIIAHRKQVIKDC